MKQRVNKNFEKLEKGYMYVFSYNLFKTYSEAHVAGSKKLTDERAKELDGYIVKIAKGTAPSAFMKGTMVAPQWCYPAPYDYEKRAQQFYNDQRWQRTHSGRRVIING